MAPSEVLKPAPFHVLLALAHGDLHGYGLLGAVRDQSGGRVVLRTASLYRHLADLMAQGFVTRHETPEADSRRTAYFRLTPTGRGALKRQQRYLVEVVATLEAVRPQLRRGRA